MDDKPRKPFTLWGDDGEYRGHGVYYPYGGNAQVYLTAHNFSAWQIATFGEVLLLDGVGTFQWERQVPKAHFKIEWKPVRPT